MNRAWPYLALLGQVLVFHRRVLFEAQSSIPFDLRTYHLPLAFQAVQALGDGRLPLWDVSVFNGFPFYANVGTQLFYPLAWPFFALANVLGFGALPKLLEWQTALHVFLGGAFAFKLLRSLNLKTGSALFGATIFELGGYFAAQTQHLGAMCGAAWLPLAWMGVVELAKRFSWRWSLGLSTALAMSFLAGFPATTIVVFGSSAMLAVLLVLLRAAPLSLIGYTALAGVWSGGLAAVQLIPTVALSRLSVARLRPQWHMTGGAPVESLVSLVVPDYYHIFDPSRYVFPFNFTFMYLYCGIAGLLLATAGLVAARRKIQLSFAVLAIVCGLWMLGSNTPGVGRLYGYIPDLVRGSMYAEFASAGVILGLASLAAFGAERFVVPRGKWAMAVLVAGTAIDLTWHGADRPMNTARTIDVDTAGPNQFEGSTSALKHVRDLTNTTFPPARIDVLGASRDWTMSASILGLQTAGGDEPLVPLRALKVRACFTQGLAWERYYTVNSVDSPLLSLLNVRYLIAAEEQPLSGHRSQIVPRGAAGRHFLFENRDALPRFFLVGEVRSASDFEESLNEVCSPAFNPARTAVVEGLARTTPAQLTSQGTLTVASYSGTLIELNIETPAPSFLVTSETAYPGWKAQINGAEVPLVIANAAFRGLAVPAGRSHVRMSFFPYDLVWGMLLTAFSSILALACCMRLGRIRSRRVVEKAEN